VAFWYRQLINFKIIISIFVVAFLCGHTAYAQIQWSEPIRISEYSLLTPRAVAVGDTIHVVATASHLRYVRSTDGGVSWAELPTPAETFYAASTPDIIYSKGRLHLLWIGYTLAPWQYHIYHCSSSDGGVTWSAPHRVFRNSSSFLKYPRLAANGDTLFAGCAISQQFLSFRSVDAGVTWQDSTAVEPGPVNISSYECLLCSGARLLMVFQLSFSGDSLGEEIYCRASNDWGLTWGDRITLSTPEPLPDYRHSQFPSGYADGDGNIIVAWFDYKYGSYCGYSGDILARASRDSGITWGPEQRLTYTQSGEASSCLIWNDTIYTTWMDDYPLGCTHPKICYSISGDWGGYWGLPQMASGMEPVGDLEPFIFHGHDVGDSVFHCVFRSHIDFEPSYICYMRGWMEVSAIENEEPPISEEIYITVYPNPFSVSSIVAYHKSDDADFEIEVFDITGRKIKAFVVGEQKGGSFTWDGTDDAGERLASGVYFLRAQNAQYSKTLKLLLLR